MPLTTQDSNDYVLISIESNKGGVGKTTAALNLASILLEKGHPVLLLDVDFTGTDIADTRNSPFWKERMNFLSDNTDVSYNLLDLFYNSFLKNGNFLNISSFENCIDTTKINVFSSNLYTKKDQTGLVCPTSLLFDGLHFEWFIDFFSIIVDRFSNKVFSSESKKPVIIFDNSPGYIGIIPIIHGWFLRIGPQKSKILHISSFDKQDFLSVCRHIDNLNNILSNKSASYNYLISLYKNETSNNSFIAPYEIEDLIHEINFHDLTSNPNKYKTKPTDFQSILINKVPIELINDHEKLNSLYRTMLKVFSPKTENEIPFFLQDKSNINYIESSYFVSYDSNVNTHFFPEDFFQLNVFNVFQNSDIQKFFSDYDKLLKKWLSNKDSASFSNIFNNNYFESSIAKSIKNNDAVLDTLYNYFASYKLYYYLQSFNLSWKIETILRDLKNFIFSNSYFFLKDRKKININDSNPEKVFKNLISIYFDKNIINNIIVCYLLYIFLFSFDQIFSSIELIRTSSCIRLFEFFVKYQIKRMKISNSALTKFFMNEAKNGLDVDFFSVSSFKNLSSSADRDFIITLYKKICYIQARINDQILDTEFILSSYYENLHQNYSLPNQTKTHQFINPYFIDSINRVVLQKVVDHQKGKEEIKTLNYMEAFINPIHFTLKNWGLE